MSQGELVELLRKERKKGYYYTCRYVVKLLGKCHGSVGANMKSLDKQGMIEKVSVIDWKDKSGPKLLFGYRILRKISRRKKI